MFFNIVKCYCLLNLWAETMDRFGQKFRTLIPPTGLFRAWIQVNQLQGSGLQIIVMDAAPSCRGSFIGVVKGGRGGDEGYSTPAWRDSRKREFIWKPNPRTWTGHSGNLTLSGEHAADVATISSHCPLEKWKLLLH